MSVAPQIATSTRARLVAVAAGALILGILVYLVDRPAGSAQLLPVAWHTAFPLGAFGPLGSVIPDFAHAFALSILTGLIAHTRRGAARACIAWWLIDSLLECAQARWAAAALGPHLPAFLSSYLLRGTFDVADLAAVALGAWLAYAALVASCAGRARAVGSRLRWCVEERSERSAAEDAWNRSQRKPVEASADQSRGAGTSTSSSGAYCCDPKMSGSPGLPLGRSR